MTISLRDYITISDAFKEAQLDEGAVWDAIKKKLGGKASPEETEAELERLKKIAPAEFAKIKAAEKAKASTTQTKAAAKASADFHARRALQKEKETTAVKPSGTRPTVSPAAAKAKFDAMDAKEYRAGHHRAAERAYAMGEAKIDNAEAAGWYAYDSKGEICQGPKTKKTDIDAKYRDQDGGAYTVVKIDQADIDRRERLSEAKEFDVRYRIRQGDSYSNLLKKVTIKGRDAADIKKKFGETHYGAKLVLITPVQEKAAKSEPEPMKESYGPLGPRS